MRGGRERVEEAAIAVVGEVDDDLRAGRDRARDLDVEQHLAIGVAARLVGALVDRHRLHRRGGADLRPREVHRQVGIAVATPELDDRDRLACAVVRREPVELGDLHRPQRLGRRRPRRRGRAGRGVGLAVRVRQLALVQAAPGLDVAARLRSVVESQHRLDQVSDVGGHVHGALAPAVGHLIGLVLPERDPERRAHLRDGSLGRGDSRRGVGRQHVQAGVAQEALDPCHLARVCAALLGQPLTQLEPGGVRAGAQRLDHVAGRARPAAHHDADTDLLVRRRVRRAARPGQRFAMAAGDLYEVGHHGPSSGRRSPDAGPSAHPPTSTWYWECRQRSHQE